MPAQLMVMRFQKIRKIEFPDYLGLDAYANA